MNDTRDAELAGYRRLLGELRLQLDVLSTIDPITGLLNRNGILDAVDAAAARQGRTSEPFGMLLVALPHLGRIRAVYGDIVYADHLRDVGALLSAALRDMDTVGRIDECSFLAVLPWVGEDALPELRLRLERVLRSRDDRLVPEFTHVFAGPYGRADADDLLALLAAAPATVGGSGPHDGA